MSKHSSTLLIAEENAETLHLWRDLFEGQGFNVLAAEDGTAAWQLFKSWSFLIRAVLIGDLMQPPLDGLDLIRRLHRLPIVVATSYGLDYVLLAKTAGATAVMRKFDEVDRLVETINQVRLDPIRFTPQWVLPTK